MGAQQKEAAASSASPAKALGSPHSAAKSFELPPNVAAHRHNESASKQQEMYVSRAGRGWIDRGLPRAPSGPRASRCLAETPH